jgi:hypothetical protein
MRNSSSWYLYKILRVLLVVCFAMSDIGAMFYGIDYYLYILGIEYYELLWIVYSSAISDCGDQSFLIQVEYAMYWALGTTSTGAYGDVSAA